MPGSVMRCSATAGLPDDLRQLAVNGGGRSTVGVLAPLVAAAGAGLAVARVADEREGVVADPGEGDEDAGAGPAVALYGADEPRGRVAEDELREEHADPE